MLSLMYATLTGKKKKAATRMQKPETGMVRSLIRDNTELLVSSGFLIVLAMMFSLVFLALVQLQSGNESMARLVQVSNSKTAAAHQMRDAIRLRSNSLKTMRLAADRFERDREYQHFISHAGKYRRARDTLVGLGMDAMERVIHRQLTELTREAQPWSENAAELLLDEASGEEVAVADAVDRSTRDDREDLLDREEPVVSFARWRVVPSR